MQSLHAEICTRTNLFMYLSEITELDVYIVQCAKSRLSVLVFCENARRTPWLKILETPLFADRFVGASGVGVGVK